MPQCWARASTQQSFHTTLEETQNLNRITVRTAPLYGIPTSTDTVPGTAVTSDHSAGD